MWLLAEVPLGFAAVILPVLYWRRGFHPQHPRPSHRRPRELPPFPTMNNIDWRYHALGDCAQRSESSDAPTRD